MGELPQIPGASRPASTEGPQQSGRKTSTSPASTSSASAGQVGGPAFEALLERLTSHAAELEEKSRSLATPEELPGAVDAARVSLEDALSLGAELLEAYRAAQTQDPEEKS
jgi:hypothetical protein